MGSAVIFSGNDVKTLKSNIDLNGGPKILSGAVDPSSVATSAPVGSMYLNTLNGLMYRKLDSGSSTNWVQVGSGSGGINYIGNPDAEANVTGWSAYADAAGVAPVDGTGGAPTVTITRTTSTPLRGTGSLLITKDAANRQGEGVSYDFLIAEADKAKPISINFEYTPSAAFVAGDSSDIRMYIYDVTNAMLIQPTPYTIQGGFGSNHKFQASFQSASNSSSYRLIFHVATTNASAWTFKFDNVIVGPQTILFGFPASDWTSYTPTIDNLGAITGLTAFYKREGDKLLIHAAFTIGTPGAALATLYLPTGLSIDSAKVRNASTASTNSSVGVYNHNGFGNEVGALLTAPASDATKIYFGGHYDGGTALTAKVGNAIFSAGDLVSLNASVPISGWSSNVQISNDADTRVVAARVGGDPASATSGNPVIFPTVAYDTHASYNATTGRYTASSSGLYRVHGYINSADTGVALSVYVNAASVIAVGSTDSNGECAYTGTVRVNAGDLIDLRPGATLDATSTSTIHFERISGPSAIAANELVSARYFASATGISGTLATISWTTKDFDSHSALSAGVFTVPAAGKYFVSSAILLSGTFVLNNTIIMEIQKNGTVVSRSTDYSGGAVTQLTGDVSDVISCLAGDTIRVQVSTSGTGPAIVSSNFDNYISIARQGF